jgi:oxygen-dependent protoporphyrinogen oxidase
VNSGPRERRTGHDAPLADVAVVGGGIAGLAAAYELHRRGVGAVVLESSPRPGGVILTERFDGWVIDAGPDALLAQKPAGVALCRDLGLEERLVSTLTPRTAFVMRDEILHPLVEGSFLGFPLTFHGLARSSLFTARGKLRMACEALIPARSSDEDESIGAFVRRRFGPEAVEYLAEPLLAGIHAGDVDRLSMQALFPRLLDAERREGSVMRAFRRLRATPSHRGAFVSLPGGTGELVDALTAALPEGTVRVSSRVTELHRAGHYVVRTPSGLIHAASVILAAPAYAAAGLLRGIDTTLAGLCDGIPYASTATVAFGYRRAQVAHEMRGSGFVVPRVERLPLLAATWVTAKWPGRAPPDHVLLRAFLGGGRDPHRLEQTDEELVAGAREALAAALGISGEPLFERLYRWTRQSPQYEVGHLDRVRSIESRLQALPGLFLAGSGFSAIGIPDCIADGRLAAGRAAAYVGGRAGDLSG